MTTDAEPNKMTAVLRIARANSQVPVHAETDTSTSTVQVDWPPTMSERVGLIPVKPAFTRRDAERITVTEPPNHEMSKMAAGSGVIPDWMHKYSFSLVYAMEPGSSMSSAAPSGVVLVTTATVPPEIGKVLVAKAAECVRGIDLLNRILRSDVLLAEICACCGTDKEDIGRMLRMKRDELILRRDAFGAPLNAPKGFTLLIELDGHKLSVG
jgi:hypothetical protein